MDNKNIIFSHTLEQYNKKYKNRNYRLAKFTKKEVEDFDKSNNTSNKYLLKGRKWCLIKDTYYEIPKPIRFTWFRNLHAGIQTGVCLLGAGVVATAVVVPTVLLKQNDKDDVIIEPTKQEVAKIEVESKTAEGTVYKVSPKDSTKKKVTAIESVYIGNDKLEVTKEYTTEQVDESIKLTIKQIAFDNHKGTVKVNPKVEDKKDPTPTEKYTVTATVNPSGAGTIEGAGEYKAGDQVTLKAKIIEKSGYDFDAWYTGDYTKVSSKSDYTFAMPNKNINLIANFIKEIEINDASFQTVIEGAGIKIKEGPASITKPVVKYKYINEKAEKGFDITISKSDSTELMKLENQKFSKTTEEKEINFNLTDDVWNSLKNGDKIVLTAVEHKEITTKAQFIKKYEEFRDTYNNSTPSYTKDDITISEWNQTALEPTAPKNVINSGSLGNRSTKVTYDDTGDKECSANCFFSADLNSLPSETEENVQYIVTDDYIEYSYKTTLSKKTIYKIKLNKNGYLEQMLDYRNGMSSFTLKYETKKDKFINLADEWVNGENGFCGENNNTEYATKDIGLEVAGKEIENVTFKYSGKGSTRKLVAIIEDENTEITVASSDFSGTAFKKLLKDEENLYYISSSGITYDDNNAKTGELKSLHFNPYGYIEEYNIVDGKNFYCGYPRQAPTEKNKFLRLYNEYNESYQKASTIFTKSEIGTFNLTIDDSQCTYTTDEIIYAGTGAGKGATIFGKNDNEETGDARIDTNNPTIKSLLNDELYGLFDDEYSVYTFNEDKGYIEYQYNNDPYEQIKYLKVNKYGYIEGYIFNNGYADNGFECASTEKPRQETTKEKFIRYYNGYKNTYNSSNLIYTENEIKNITVYSGGTSSDKTTSYLKTSVNDNVKNTRLITTNTNAVFDDLIDVNHYSTILADLKEEGTNVIYKFDEVNGTINYTDSSATGMEIKSLTVNSYGYVTEYELGNKLFGFKYEVNKEPDVIQIDSEFNEQLEWYVSDLINLEEGKKYRFCTTIDENYPIDSFGICDNELIFTVEGLTNYSAKNNGTTINLAVKNNMLKFDSIISEGFVSVDFTMSKDLENVSTVFNKQTSI